MKLYKICQAVNKGYDSYDSAVVAAESEEEAKMIHPNKYVENWDGNEKDYGTWTSSENVVVEHLGEAKEGTVKGIIVKSFNAG